MSIHFGTSAHARCITWANSLCSCSESSPSEASSKELNSQLERLKSKAKVLKARPRARGRKPKDFMVRDYFDIVQTSSSTYCTYLVQGEKLRLEEGVEQCEHHFPSQTHGQLL